MNEYLHLCVRVQKQLEYSPSEVSPHPEPA
jgi:hypothetical protein